MWTLILNSLYFIALLAGLRSGQPRVRIGGTTFIGKRLETPNLEFFGGIPFAEPPVDGLRFSPPKPKHFLSPLRSFDASKYGKPCLQPQWGAEMSEDCLTLNVFRPSGVDGNSSLPVMVWIYGGGFMTGTSSLYDGTPLVEQSVNRGTPILYVSINYRLGPLGFPQGPEAVGRAVLNLGLQDQWTALEWVQNNIASFGGDPRKVTVFGESAGALSASYHHLNENFSAVARAAIFQSGTASTLPIFDPYRGIPSWMLFANHTRTCATASSPNINDTFECLMSASASDLLVGINAGLAIEPWPFRAVLDGPEGIMSDLPARRLSHGAGGRVPFIAGTVLDEGTIFLPRGFKTEDITTWLKANFTPSPLGPDALSAGMAKVLSVYPDDPSAGSPFGTGNETFGSGPGYKRAAAIYGDLLFQAPRRFWNQMTIAPSYAYIFMDPQPNGDPAVGVFHSVELPYLFGGLGKSGPTKVAWLSRVMLDYWISFAVSLTPNDGKGTSRPYWGMYGETKDVLELNSNDVRLIPDDYRDISIDVLLGMSETLSW